MLDTIISASDLNQSALTQLQATESTSEEEDSSSSGSEPVITRRSKFDDEEDDSDVGHGSFLSHMRFAR